MRVGFIGWRGMVGSVLMDRMVSEGDFKTIEAFFFTTSQMGQAVPVHLPAAHSQLLDARDIAELQKMDAIVSCQGGGYTGEIHPQLRSAGWKGYWIDAASTLRMESTSTIVLDPVNGAVIKESLAGGTLDFVGGNCTVSLMLMGIAGLFRENLVEWVSSMTYQAASGAGAAFMNQLVDQMGAIYQGSESLLSAPSVEALKVERQVQKTQLGDSFPSDVIGGVLAGGLIPWIDREMPNGQSREEWKGMAETNKILGLAPETIPVDGTCVRIGAMRCHSQGLTIKLKKDIGQKEVEEIIASSTQWSVLVPNTMDESVKGLSPAAIAGTLQVPVGRVRPMNLGKGYFNAFTVGDQLLWGAAEPLRRMVKILVEHRS